ncbi:MAG: AI-2E family transporter [Myxococcales bacterium]|nr:AI-2E family transporter [Myxococcales bacterium]
MEEAPERITRLPSLGPVGSARRRLVFFAVTVPGAIGILYFFREVLTPFALALVIAYVLAPVVARLERIRFGDKHVPRWVAVVFVYVLLLGGLGTSIGFGAPRLVAETTRAAREAPRAAHALREEWLPQLEEALRGAAALYRAPSNDPVAETPPEEPARGIRIVPHEDGSYEVALPPDGIEVTREGNGVLRIHVEDGEREERDLGRAVTDSIREFFSDTEAYAGAALESLQTVVARVVGGVFSFFIMLMLSAYMLITSDRIIGFFRSLARRDQRERFDDLIARIDRGLAGVIRGQLVIAMVNGVLSGIGFWLADLPYWPVLTLIATALSIIPIFGAIISSVPAVLVGLQQGIGTALFVLAWIIGIHQIEANLLNPKIMGDAAKVHPVLVVFALLAGEHVFGIVGALLAVPLLSITQSVFLHFREVALGVPKDPALAKEWAEATLDRPAILPEEE